MIVPFGLGMGLLYDLYGSSGQGFGYQGSNPVPVAVFLQYDTEETVTFDSGDPVILS